MWLVLRSMTCFTPDSYEVKDEAKGMFESWCVAVVSSFNLKWHVGVTHERTVCFELISKFWRRQFYAINLWRTLSRTCEYIRLRLMRADVLFCEQGSAVAIKLILGRHESTTQCWSIRCGHISHQKRISHGRMNCLRLGHVCSLSREKERSGFHSSFIMITCIFNNATRAVFQRYFFADVTAGSLVDLLRWNVELGRLNHNKDVFILGEKTQTR